MAERTHVTPIFEVGRRRSGGAVVLEFMGELDLDAHSEATRALEEAVTTEDTVVLDLEGLRFMDSTGVHCLWDAKRLADARATRMAILNGSGPPHRVLALTGLDQRLETIDHLEPLVAGPG